MARRLSDFAHAVSFPNWDRVGKRARELCADMRFMQGAFAHPTKPLLTQFIIPTIPGLCGQAQTAVAR